MRMRAFPVLIAHVALLVVATVFVVVAAAGAGMEMP